MRTTHGKLWLFKSFQFVAELTPSGYKARQASGTRKIIDIPSTCWSVRAICGFGHD